MPLKMSVQQERSEVDADQELDTDVQPVVDTEPEAVVLNSDELSDAADSIAGAASITDFTAPRSNINHGHDPSKHDIRKVYGVRDEFVKKHFAKYGIAPNDHAALWLMSYRKEEFIAANEPIFNGAPDDDSSKWQSIEQRKTSAPIAPETQRELKP